MVIFIPLKLKVLLDKVLHERASFSVFAESCGFAWFCRVMMGRTASQ